MAILAFFNGLFCNEEHVIKEVVRRIGYTLVTDARIVSHASELSDVAPNKIEKVFSAATAVFNRFNHERERAVAYLKLATAEIIMHDECIVAGFCSQLIPRDIDHVLHVCLVSGLKARIRSARKEKGLPEEEALKWIRMDDKERGAYIHSLFPNTKPWDPAFYDMVVAGDRMPLEKIAGMIQESLDNPAVQPTQRSLERVADFATAARVEVALIQEGHKAAVAATSGRITLTLEKQVLMLNRLEIDLKRIAGAVPGVSSVEVQVDQRSETEYTYVPRESRTNAKILLVDDEVEFVDVLSDRLKMRELDSEVVYDGADAIRAAREDEPDMMILDLRMPGIDGIEVLQKIKATQPDIEVIVLTGHGTAADEETCMRLGAFAYLSKPVDLEELSRAIQAARRKIQEQRATTDGA